MLSSGNRQEAVAKLRELIKDIRFAMLTTRGHEGTLHSRPMVTQQTEFDGDLWFFTGEGTTKAAEIAEFPDVNVSYADPDDHRYVSVSGRASLVRDPAKNEELWNPAYRAWFPKGLADPDLALLKVTVEKAEYWDSPSSRMVAIAGFVKAVATGRRFTPGTHERLELDPSGN